MDERTREMIPDGAIGCVFCGEILTLNYEGERGHAESSLYTHVCAKLPVFELVGCQWRRVE